ncbi:MAG TPA: hypothetical protein VD811_15280, partial [Desulfuromonadales bacterium]|nr:hypothetical protein [Desulfuromonadales bacterium]
FSCPLAPADPRLDETAGPCAANAKDCHPGEGACEEIGCCSLIPLESIKRHPELTPWRQLKLTPVGVG